MSHQIAEISAWFGIAGLALVWASFQLWHRSRTLDRTRPDVSQRKHLPAPSDDETISSPATRS